jgi:hypothetical protein
MTMNAWWNAHWFEALGLAIGLVSLIGVYFSWKSWHRQKPQYVLHSNNILSGTKHAIPKVEIKFEGYGPPITSLTVTKIAFWNQGNQTIHKADIVKGTLFLRAKCPAIILDVEVIERTNPDNKFGCKRTDDRSGANIAFAFLAPKDGALLQVFHTGTGDADFSIEGSFKSGQKIIRRAPTYPMSVRRRRWIPMVDLAWPWICLSMLLPAMIDPSLVPGGPMAYPTLYYVAVIGCLISLPLVTYIKANSLYVTTPPSSLSGIYSDKPQ